MMHYEKTTTAPRRPIGLGRRLTVTCLGALCLGSAIMIQAFPAARAPSLAVEPVPVAAAGDPVIAAAGDISCDPTNSNFNAGNGSSGSCREKYTSDLLVGQPLSAVLDLGDNQYYCGGYQAFLQAYDPTWGRVKSITYPAVGNHEYLTSGGTDCDTSAKANGHFKYFGAAAGDPTKGYYSFDIGAWHLIMLNSNCGAAGGCGATTPQGTWLRSDLAAHSNACTLAFWHVPVYSSGGRADTTYTTFYQALFDADADLVLNGHDHIYERFAPQDAAGHANASRGIREFVAGTGGANHTTIAKVAANSEVRNADTFGILQLTLHPTSYDWKFVAEAGETFTDSGTANCHGPGTDTIAPSVPTGLTAVATGAGSVGLHWNASSDNVAVAGYRVYRGGVAVGSSTTTSYTDSSLQPLTSYTYTVSAFDGSGNASAPSSPATATTPADSTAPSTPTGLAASAPTSKAVNLTWTSSTDDVGVSRYLVYRGGAAIGQSAVPSFTDTTVQPLTSYTYSVAAGDAAGNTSPPSATATVTTPAPTTSFTINPVADARIELGAAGSNFGTDVQLIADNSPVKASLLKFSVTGVGPVKTARLRLYCVDPSDRGGDLHLVRDSSWAETSVTWNTAPAADSGLLGSLGAVATGGWYEFDVGSIVTGDGTYSFEITSTSADGAHYSSKEGAQPPQLLLTIDPPPSGGTIAGTVTDAVTGGAISGAPVTVTGASAVTDQLGGYSLPGLAAGSYSVTAAATGYDPSTRNASVTAGATTSLNFALQPRPGSLAGTVTDAGTGQPLSGATVSFSSGSQATGLDGTFSFTAVAPGTYTVSAAATGFVGATQVATVQPGATATTNFALSAQPGTIAGRVTDAVQQPIAGASVSVSSGGGSGITDQAGAYSISGVPRGTYSVTATAGGYVAQTKTVAVTSGATTTLDFSLDVASSPGGITGHVTDAAAGSGIPGASVTFSGGSTSTDQNGAYSFSGVVPGTYSVSAAAAGFLTQTSNVVVSSGTVAQLDLALSRPPPGAISGHVTDAGTGQALAGATVSGGGTSATSDSAGLYSLNGLAPGSYAVTAAASGHVSQTASVTLASATTITQDFALSAVSTAIFRDDFETGSLAAWTAGSTGLVVESTIVHAGGFAAEANTTNGTTYARKLLPATYQSAYSRVYFRINAQASSVQLIGFRTAANGSIAKVLVDGPGRLLVRNDVTAVSLTGGPVSIGAWHWVELHLVVSGATSSVEVWLDGVAVPALTTTQDLGTTPVAMIQLGENQAARTYDVVFDDVVVATSRIGP